MKPATKKSKQIGIYEALEQIKNELVKSFNVTSITLEFTLKNDQKDIQKGMELLVRYLDEHQEKTNFFVMLYDFHGDLTLENLMVKYHEHIDKYFNIKQPQTTFTLTA
jgi:hypothetical protein